MTLKKALFQKYKFLFLRLNQKLALNPCVQSQSALNFNILNTSFSVQSDCGHLGFMLIFETLSSLDFTMPSAGQKERERESCTHTQLLPSLGEARSYNKFRQAHTTQHTYHISACAFHTWMESQSMYPEHEHAGVSNSSAC